MPRNRHPDLDAMIGQLDVGLFVKWMKRAQKLALMEWRDRLEPPGLAARFTAPGAAFYRFSPRSPETDKRKGYLPPFVKTGGTRDLVTARKPREIKGDWSNVITRLAFGGGAINFLTDVHPVDQGAGRTPVMLPVRINAYTYTRAGRTVSVPATVQVRKVIVRHDSKKADSYADEYARFTQDQAWIQNRIAEIFGGIYRGGALTKGGKIKTKAFVEAAYAS